ncbi:MAG: GDSL-type esterase/lipase family protein [bacterium]
MVAGPDRLKTHFLKKDCDVYNLSISGDNTNKLLKRFYSECETRYPDVIMIAIGINDSQDIKSTNGKRVEINQFENNLKMIIEQGKKLGKIIFVGPTKVNESKTAPVLWNNDRTYLNKHILQYNSIIKSLCAEKNLPFIEMLDLLNDDDLEDGLHPNAAGHRKMFERIKQFFGKNKFDE